MASVTPQVMKGFGEGLWRGDSQLWWSGGKKGDELLLELQVKEPGKYEVAVGMTKAPDYAIVEFSVNGKKTESKSIDLYQPKGVSPTGRVSLGYHQFKMGVATLGVQLIGSHPDAKPGMMVALDYVEVKKVE